MYLALRSYLLPLHRWTGMTVGLVIVLMALTGAATMFRPQLEPVFNRALLTVPNCAARLPLDRLAEAARAAHPGVRLDALHLVAGADAEPRMPAAELRFADQVYVYVNPCGGAVLGQRARFGGALGSIEQLHRFRFMRNGSLVTGACALLFAIVMIGGGLCLWLPATLRGIGNALRFNLSFTGQARRLNRHKTIGVYAALVVLSSALTGLPQALPWVGTSLYVLAGSPLPAGAPAMAPATAAARLPIEELWQRAQALAPQPREALIYVGGASVEAWLIARDAPHANARSLLWLDPVSGATLRFVPYPQASAGHRLFYWTLSWHTGQIGGWPVQLLLLAGALCIPVLAYTGIGSYLRRKRRKPMAGRLVLKVASKRAESDDVCCFELVDPNGAALPPFAAGAHIQLHIGGAMLRDYSLCNDPHDTHRYEIAVLRERHSRGGSRALHDDHCGRRPDRSKPAAQPLSAGAGRHPYAAAGRRHRHHAAARDGRAAGARRRRFHLALLRPFGRFDRLHAAAAACTLRGASAHPLQRRRCIPVDRPAGGAGARRARFAVVCVRPGRLHHAGAGHRART